MMIAKHTYPWGSLEVRFEVSKEGTPAEALRILRAHAAIMDIMDELARPEFSAPAAEADSEEYKVLLAQRMVSYLNELLALDHDAMSQLMNTYVETGGALAEHPTLQVIELMSASPLYGVGPLGLINGFIGERDKVGYVTSVYDDNGKLERFEVTTEENRAKMKPMRVRINERKQQETGTDDDASR